MKPCIKISDRIGIIDLVAALGEKALRSEWVGHDIWIVHEGDDHRLEDMCSSGQRVSGSEFVSALQPIIQVIDGRFEAFEEESKEPWVAIESTDSSFHLLHADESVLKKARAMFSDVTDYDPPAVPWKRGRQEPNKLPEPMSGQGPDMAHR